MLASSRDIDFIHPLDLDTAVAGLAALAAADPAPDPFAFDIAATTFRQEDHLSVSVTARVGAAVIDNFSIDVTRRAVIGAVEIIRAEPVIVIDDVDDLPPFLAVPLAQQIADKLCAIYETHGPGAIKSSRYRDLVDLMIITSNTHGIDAAAVAITIAAEQARRGMTIPIELPSPSRQWTTGYRNLASRTVAPDLHHLSDAFDQLRAFAGPILTGTVTGTWNPSSKRWTPGT